MTLAQIDARLRDFLSDGGDAQGDPSPLAQRWIRDDHVLAYSAAHHAVAALVARFGPGVMARIVDDAVERGATIDEALLRVTGLDRDALWRDVVGALKPAP
jgi:hypothetical protein